MFTTFLCGYGFVFFKKKTNFCWFSNIKTLVSISQISTSFINEIFRSRFLFAWNQQNIEGLEKFYWFVFFQVSKFKFTTHIPKSSQMKLLQKLRFEFQYFRTKFVESSMETRKFILPCTSFFSLKNRIFFKKWLWILILINLIQFPFT